MVKVIRMRNYAVLPLVILQVSFILAIIFLIAINQTLATSLLNYTKMLLHSAGRVSPIWKLSRKLQGDFPQFGNDPASCMELSKYLEVMLHTAGAFPKKNRGRIWPLIYPFNSESTVISALLHA